LPVFSIAGSDTKKITVKNLVQQGAALVDDASIPVAKVNLSGISGTNLTAGTVAASKLDTSTIPATGGVTVSSSNLQLVAPTSPIVRNAGTGSLEHATSGASAGTYTKVTVDTKGHVTVGASLAGTDLPLATTALVGGISVGTGLAVTGGGVLNHSNSVGTGTTSGITRDAQGHITGAVALVSADLPLASAGVPGAVSPGTGTSINGAGALSVTAATSSVLGGVIAGSDFAVSTGTISLATQAGLTAGAYPKLTVTTKGIVTAGAALVAGDIPSLDASKLTTGTLSISLLGTNSITGAKLANYSTIQFGGAGSTTGVVTFPTPDFTGQGFYDSSNQDYYIYDGNTWQPLTVISGNLVYAGTYNANTNRVASVTTAGTAGGLAIGSALPAGSATLNQYYVVVSESGNGVSPAPVVALAPPDMIICNGATWDLVDVSNAIAGQTATNISFTPYGNLAATNVQTALQELDDEKIAKTGGTVTGELLIGTAGTFAFEGATANAYETYLSATDPTADRAIVFPDQSGNVIISGNTSIVNADINASAGIVDTKLATIATAGKVSNSATSAVSINTASAIVARDASGNFTAGTITAALTGTASGNLVSGGALGTPSSGTLTNCTFPTLNQSTTGNAATVTTNANLTGHITSVGNAAVLGSFTSAQLAAALTDETGSGVNVFATSPTLVTPEIGAATGTSLSAIGAAGLLTRAAATQDGVELIGRAGGTTSLKATITPATLTASRTITLPDATTTLAGLGVVQSFTVAQRGAITALTDGATITADFAAANNFSVTLGGNRTLANPSNQTAGQSGCIWITQDGTGSRTLAYGSQWDFTGGTAPTLSTAAASVDCLVYAVQSSTKITATLISNLS
jgi:hypothetical protein